MKGMIFAAGLGTRLRPLTDSMPKAMVPVAGKALLDYVVDVFDAAGIREIVVNTHHFPEQISGRVSELSQERPQLHFELSEEQPLPLETGGGILHARRFLEGCGSFLVHNVDILSNLDVQDFIESNRKDALANLVVSSRETSRYLLCDDDCRLVGWTNIKTGELRTPFPELDLSHLHRYAFAGIHMISDRVFDVMQAAGFSGAFSIMDFYLTVCRDYPVYLHVVSDLRLMDVGKIETLSDAENFVNNEKR